MCMRVYGNVLPFRLSLSFCVLCVCVNRAGRPFPKGNICTFQTSCVRKMEAEREREEERHRERGAVHVHMHDTLQLSSIFWLRRYSQRRCQHAQQLAQYSCWHAHLHVVSAPNSGGERVGKSDVAKSRTDLASREAPIGRYPVIDWWSDRRADQTAQGRTV